MACVGEKSENRCNAAGQRYYWLPSASGYSPTLVLSKEDVVVYKDYSGGTWCTRGNLLGICVAICSFMLLKGYSLFRTARCCWPNFSNDYYPNY